VGSKVVSLELIFCYPLITIMEERMFTFLSNNIGTIITGLVLLVIIAAVIIKIRRDKKKNNSACAGCPCGCGVRDDRID